MWLAYFLTFYILFVAIVCYSSRVATTNNRNYGFVKRQSRDYFFVVLAYLPLMVMACFRSGNVGNDNIIYINFFCQVQEELSYFVFSLSTRFEPGFVLYNKVLAYFFDSPQALLFTSSFIILASVIRTIMKYSASVWLSVFLFFCIYFNSTMVTMRQYLALAILLFSFDYIVKRRFICFLLLWLLACTFHYTAAVFIAAYFVYNLKINKKILTKFVLLLPVVVLLSFVLLQPFLDIFHDEGMYEYYNDQNKYVKGGVRLATTVLITLEGIVLTMVSIVFKVTKDKNILNHDGVNRLLYLYCMIGLFIVALSFPFNLFSRVGTFFSFFNCILIPNAIHELSRRRKYNAANKMGLFYVVLYGTYYIVINTYRPEWTRIYPYEFCF